MNEIRIVISILVPDGVTPSVDYGTAPSTGATAPPSSPPQPPAQGSSSSPASAGWVCPEHGTSKVVPAGTSKKTGKPYNAFTACGEQGCDRKPPRGPANPPPLPEAKGEYDDLPF